MRRQKSGISRQDSRLSVKSLIESIENAQKQAKTAGSQDGVNSRCRSSSSLNSLNPDQHHNHHYHSQATTPNNGQPGVNGGDYNFENNTKLITFTRSQSHHGSDWIENNNNNNNQVSFNFNNIIILNCKFCL